MVECTRSPLTFFGRKVEQIKTGFLLSQLRAKVPGISLQQAIKKKENYFVPVYSGLYEVKYNILYDLFYHTRSIRQGFIIKYSKIFEP